MPEGEGTVGKKRGKGKDPGHCYNCGLLGHAAWRCDLPCVECEAVTADTGEHFPWCKWSHQNRRERRREIADTKPKGSKRKKPGRPKPGEPNVTVLAPQRRYRNKTPKWWED